MRSSDSIHPLTAMRCTASKDRLFGRAIA